MQSSLGFFIGEEVKNGELISGVINAIKILSCQFICHLLTQTLLNQILFLLSNGQNARIKRIENLFHVVPIDAVHLERVAEKLSGKFIQGQLNLFETLHFKLILNFAKRLRKVSIIVNMLENLLNSVKTLHEFLLRSHFTIPVQHFSQLLRLLKLMLKPVPLL